MTLPMTTPVPPPSVRQMVVFLTTLVAGAVGSLIAYWTWRMVLGVPVTLVPGSGIIFADTRTVIPAGPSWLWPTLIAATIGMALWPVLAANASRMSLIGGSAAIVVVSLLIFPIAAICVEVSTLTQHGWPSLPQMVLVAPSVLFNAVEVTFINLLYCGLITVPVAALVGLLLAAFGRFVTRGLEVVGRTHE
jgi:hypothetical protein